MTPKNVISRIAMSGLLLFTFGETSENLLNYFQAPNIFGGIAAIASFIGASFPVLTMFKDSK